MDVFSLTMRLKEEGAAQVKASLDKMRVSLNETAASAKVLDTNAQQMAAAQRAWAAETRGLKSSMASGNLSLAEASKQYDAMIASMAAANAVGKEQKAVVEKATGAFAGQNTQLRSLRDGLVTLSSQMLGTNAAGVRLTSTLGTMVAGQALIVGVLAGITAISVAYDKLTADTRKLREEQDAAVESLNKLARAQQFGVGGELATNIATANKRLDSLRNDLKAAEREAQKVALGAAQSGQIGLGAGVPGKSVYAQKAAAEIKAARDRVDALKETIAKGELELKKILVDARDDYSMERSQQLRDLVLANRATLAEQRMYAAERKNVEEMLLDTTLSAAKRQRLVAQLEILTPPEAKKNAVLKLVDELTDITSANAIAKSGIPQIPIQVEAVPVVSLPPEFASGNAGVFKDIEADFVNGWADMMDRAAAQMGNILVDSIASAFENLTAVGGSIKSAFKVLTSGLLSGLGSMLIEFGRYVIVAGKLMAAVRASLSSMNPIAAVAAGVAMIAIGGMLRGAASRAFSGAPAVGGGSGYAEPAMSQNFQLPTQYYGPTAAGSANTIERVNPISVTIIGPNDPSAQRQMQELLRNADRRGSV